MSAMLCATACNLRSSDGGAKSKTSSPVAAVDPAPPVEAEAKPEADADPSIDRQTPLTLERIERVAGEGSAYTGKLTARSGEGTIVERTDESNITWNREWFYTMPGDRSGLVQTGAPLYDDDAQAQPKKKGAAEPWSSMYIYHRIDMKPQDSEGNTWAFSGDTESDWSLRREASGTWTLAAVDGTPKLIFTPRIGDEDKPVWEVEDRGPDTPIWVEMGAAFIVMNEWKPQTSGQPN